MFNKSAIQDPFNPSLDITPLPEFFIELDEQEQESMSGGSNKIINPAPKDPEKTQVVAFVLLFANPFS